VVDSDESTGEEKTRAAEAIARIASYIEAESNIETLVKSKGFSQCVAVVSEDNVSVIVGTEDTLMANELAQIKEIVYLQTGVDPTAMRITEKIIEST
jgi:stage III sporulation protein AH